MCCYFLSVSGIKLQLKSDQVLSVDEAFLPFLEKVSKPDIRAVFCQTEMLSFSPDQELYRDGGWQVCLREDGIPVRFFYNTPEDQIPYALAIRESNTLRVEYHPSDAWRFSQMQNCFFYLDLEQILMQHHRLWPHASCVETPLGGILFSGVSGIGKSTQAELWCKYRNARQINGDRPILSQEAGRWFAWGAPYAGSSRCYVNDKCPVTAVIMLQQAKECSLRRMNPREAFGAVWKGLALHSWDRAYMEQASNLAMDLVATIAVYEFCCTPDEQAVSYLDQALRKELKL